MQYKGYEYKIVDIDAEWSEGAVQYTIYDEKGELVLQNECEEHMANDYAEEDIDLLIKERI